MNPPKQRVMSQTEKVRERGKQTIRSRWSIWSTCRQAIHAHTHSTGPHGSYTSVFILPDAAGWSAIGSVCVVGMRSLQHDNTANHSGVQELTVRYVVWWIAYSGQSPQHITVLLRSSALRVQRTAAAWIDLPYATEVPKHSRSCCCTVPSKSYSARMPGTWCKRARLCRASAHRQEPQLTQ